VLGELTNGEKAADAGWEFSRAQVGMTELRRSRPTANTEMAPTRGLVQRERCRGHLERRRYLTAFVSEDTCLEQAAPQAAPPRVRSFEVVRSPVRSGSGTVSRIDPGLPEHPRPTRRRTASNDINLPKSRGTSMRGKPAFAVDEWNEGAGRAGHALGDGQHSTASRRAPAGHESQSSGAPGGHVERPWRETEGAPSFHRSSR